MKATLVIFLIAFFIGANSQTDIQCFNFEAVTTLPQGKCLDIDEGINKVAAQFCLKGQECSYDSVKKVGTCTNSTYYPGEKCDSEQQCLSGNCLNSTCIGAAEGENCTKNLDCDPGFFCNVALAQPTCAKQLSEGDACTNLWDCKNDLVCNGLKCVQYFSDPLGTNCIVHDWKSDFLGSLKGFSWSCSTMFCIQESGSGPYQCSKAPVSQTPMKTCTSDQDCIVQDFANAACNCAVQNEGQIDKGFCETQTGDQAAISWQTDMQFFVLPYMKNTQNYCNTEGRFRFECWDLYQTDVQIQKSFASIFTYDWFSMVNGGFNVENNDEAVISSLNLDFDLYAAYKDLANAQCSSYQCVSSIEDNICLNQSESQNSYKVLNQCPIADEYCPLFDLPCQHASFCEKENYYNSKQAAGQFCRFGSNCYSGICNDNWMCVGLVENDACIDENDFSCEIGLACIGQKCKPQIAIGGTGCVNDWQCVNTALCRGGTCYQVFTQPVNTEIVGAQCLDSSKKEAVCASFTCDNNEKGNLICVDSYKSTATMPIQTTSQYECKATQGERQYFSSLNCDFKAGNSYCAPHTGDSITTDLTAQANIIKTTYNDQGICHSIHRFSQSCWEYKNNDGDKLTQLQNFKLKMNRWSYYPALETNFAEECVRNVFMPEYQSAKAGFTKKSYPEYNSDIPRLCASSKQTTLDKDVCKEKRTIQGEGYWLYQSCTDGKSCIQDTDAIWKCVTPEPANQTNYLWPGMPCSSDYQCKGKSNKCLNLQCTGILLGQECAGSSDDTCDVGLACISDGTKYICQKQIQAGSASYCENDYQCENSAVCRDRLCIEYFSSKVGQDWTGQCESNTRRIDHSCSSLTCYNTLTKAQCINPFDYNDKICASNDDCVQYTLLNDGSTENVDLKETCSSSYNATKYCRAATGSQYALEYIALFKKIYKEDQGKCHSYARRNPSCWQFVFHDKTHVDLIYNFVSAQQSYENYPNIQTGDQCTNQIDFSIYYDAEFNEHYPHDYTLDCPLFKCASDEEKKQFEKDQCIQYQSTEDTFLIKDCQKDQLCNATYEKVNNTCFTPSENHIIEQSRKVGSQCSSTKDCVGEAECHSGWCKGKSKGKKCEKATSLDCDVGLACIKDKDNTYKCLDQLGLNETCEDILQCVNYGECRDGKCTEYFQLQWGQVSGKPCQSSREDLLCESMTCNQESLTTSVCTSSFKTYTDTTKFNKCGENIDCQFTNSDGVLWEGQCKCSMSETQSYCSAGSGDQVALNYKKAFLGIYKLDQGKCHSSMRREFECWNHELLNSDETSDKYQQYILALYNYTEYPVVRFHIQIQKADLCAIKAYYNEWYLASEGFNDSARLLAYMSFIFLFFI